MDHSHIEEHDLVDRYLAGRLSSEELVNFEAHFVDCQLCQDQIELGEEFATAMRAAAVEDASRALFQMGLFAMLAKWSRARQAALGLALVGLLSLPAVWFNWEARTLQQRVWLAETQLKRIGQPQVNTPDFLLSLVRSADPDARSSIPEIVVNAASPWLTLSLEIEPDPAFQSYIATAETAAGRVLWTGSGIQPNIHDVVSVTFPSRLFYDGEFRMVVEALTQQGVRLNVGEFPFRFSWLQGL